MFINVSNIQVLFALKKHIYTLDLQIFVWTETI